ncbi:MAG: hypothetical protein J6P58_05735 [Oscillospiraceae bacterium]|nr:hypothetical protein [Oscillospiraceae bacterium]
MLTYYELTSPQALAALRDYLVLALRSTGPDPASDRVFQLGMLRVEDGQIVNRNSALIDPGVPIPTELTELTGVSDEAAHGGLRYSQMAASLAKLLQDGVVVADEEALGFVRHMLEGEGFAGKFAFVDVRTLAQSLMPELESDDPEAIAAALDIEAEEEPGILREAALRQAILCACQALLPAEDSPEDDAAPEDTEREKPPKPAGEARRPKARLPLIRSKARPAPKKKRRKDAFSGVWDMSSEDFIGYIAALASVVAALIFMPSWSSLLYLLAALVFLPIRPLRRRLRRWRLDGWRVLAIGLALFVLASVFKPHTPGAGKPRSENDGPPAFIILSWNEEGEYGQPWTAENDEGVEESYIAFHLPVGIYRVLNNNAASAKVTVCDDVPEEKSTDIQDLLLEESIRTVTVLASKSKELTLDEGQHLRLSENAENVIFQYLGEIPEVVEEEKDESEDPNATAITAWVNGKEVRMRKSASVSAFIMATFDTGKEVLVTGETGDWTAVTVDNQKGYIYSRYITYEKPTE